MPKICFKNCRICMFSIELGNHIFVSVLIIYLRMTLTLFGIEAFRTLPITWVIPVYFGQQIVIKWLLMCFHFGVTIMPGRSKWFLCPHLYVRMTGIEVWVIIVQCQLRKPEGYGQNRGLQNKAKHIKMWTVKSIIWGVLKTLIHVS